MKKKINFIVLGLQERNFNILFLFNCIDMHRILQSIQKFNFFSFIVEKLKRMKKTIRKISSTKSPTITELRSIENLKRQGYQWIDG